MYKTLDSVITKVNMTVVALKQFSVHWGEQAPANFKDVVKTCVELMDPENYREKRDKIRVSS